LEYASSFVVYGSLTALLCMFANPAFTTPELFQDEYKLMRVIHTHPTYVWAHLVQIISFAVMCVGVMAIAMFTLGLLQGSNIKYEPSEKDKFKGLILFVVSLLSAGIAVNFLVIDGLGLKEVASRMVEQNVDEVLSVFYATDVLGIDNGFVAAMIIFWGGATPTLLGWVVKDWHPAFKNPSKACIIFGWGAVLGGLGYTMLFFANVVALSDDNQNMEPYYAATTLMFVFAVLSLLSATWVSGSIWLNLRKLREGKGPLFEKA